MIKPEGWSNWHDTDHNKTAYYAEYQNTGPGAVMNRRVKWSYQLTDNEAKQYMTEKIFGGWQQ